MKQGGSSAVLSVAVLDAPVHKEEVDTKLDAARDQLTALRRQQEELEQQKADLEELRRKQDEYTRGKAEMIENIARALVALEHEQLRSERSAEQCEQTTVALKDYLDQLHAIHDDNWSSVTIRTELSRALGVIENSRLEFNRARTKLDCLNPSAGQAALTAAPAAPENELIRYAKLGAAASAPLIVAGTIWIILLLTFKN